MVALGVAVFGAAQPATAATYQFASAQGAFCTLATGVGVTNPNVGLSTRYVNASSSLDCNRPIDTIHNLSVLETEGFFPNYLQPYPSSCINCASAVAGISNITTTVGFAQLQVDLFLQVSKETHDAWVTAPLNGVCRGIGSLTLQCTIVEEYPII